MCRAAAVTVLVLTVIGTGASGQSFERLPGPGDARSPAESIALLQTRAESLALEWRRAKALADMVDSLEQAPGSGNDTIRVGALRIITNRSPVPLRGAALRAWPVIDSLYGRDALQLEARPLLVAAYDPDTTVPRPALRGALQVPWDQDASSLALILLTNLPMGPADSALRNWLGVTVVTPVPLPARQRAAVYVELVTAPSLAARACFAGAITSCRVALGLVTGPEPVTRWYPSAAERRAVVKRTFPADVVGATRTRLQSCLGGDDGACLELLRGLAPEALPKPLGGEARETLLHVALQVGGRAAYHRLMTAVDHPMSERLALAAGMSTDSLLTRWRAVILAARPMPVALPPDGVWIGLGWALVFALCGLRSSRWRVS